MINLLPKKPKYNLSGKCMTELQLRMFATVKSMYAACNVALFFLLEV